MQSREYLKPKSRVLIGATFFRGECVTSEIPFWPTY
jgi:hypothetical protein